MASSPSLRDHCLRIETSPYKTSSPFSFLRNSQSTDRSGERKVSRGPGIHNTTQANLDRKGELSQYVDVVDKQPPNLPEYIPQPLLKAFSTEEGGPDHIAIISNQIDKKMVANTAIDIPSRSVSSILIAPAPASSPDENMHPQATPKSMTNRGRYSYTSSPVSTLHAPRRVRRRRDPTPYNILVIGARGSGKTSFLDFLRMSLAPSSKKRPSNNQEESPDSPLKPQKVRPNFVPHYLESEIDNERIGLTFWDSKGLDKSVVDLQLREMSSFLENKFEDTFNEEMKVVRAPGNRDSLIHCVFFVLDPVRLDANIHAAQQNLTNESRLGRYSKTPRNVGALAEDFELQVFRTFQGKTTVIPVISKADTITTSHMAFLKKRVKESLRKAGLDLLEVLDSDGDEEDSSESDDLGNESNGQDADDEQSEEGRPGTRDTADSDTLPREPATPKASRENGRKLQSSVSACSVVNAESELLPFSTLSPDTYDQEQGDEPAGRKFPWGFADPHNPDHCDFAKLKENCFGEWRTDLRRASKEIFYEKWRTSRLNQRMLSPIEGANRSVVVKYGNRTTA